MPNACSDAARMARQIARYLSSCQQDIDAGRPVVMRQRALEGLKALREALDAAERELADG